jgi:hypothetical protein
MSPQTIPQILRCLTLGRYAATVEGDELRIRGPQPLAGPLPASIRARRDELITFLSEHCGATWPAAPGSDAYNPPTSRKGWDARVREWLQKPREERAREFRQRLRERREGAA